MELTQKKYFLLKEVFTKVKFDKLTNRFQVLPETYLLLKLSDKELKLLEQMCIDNDIDLIKLPKRLSNKETIELFKEYQTLKERLKLEKSEEIEKKIYIIRNKIAEGYMEVTLRIILKYFPEITSREDKEDIYQAGYETLLYFIDNFDPNKNNKFISHLNKYFISHLTRRIAFLSDGISLDDNNNLYILIKERNKFNLKYNRMPTVIELANILEMKEKDIELLLLLEKRINHDSLDEKLELLNENDNDDLDFPNISIEEDVIKLFNRERVIDIIETLPITQRNCLLLYFGFIGNRSYRYNEIAEMLKISLEGVRQSISCGLENIKNSIRGKALSKIYDIDSETEITDQINFRHSDEVYLIYYLIKRIPKKEIIKLMEQLNEKNKETLMMYLGLYDGNEYTKEEIAHKFGVSTNTICERLRNSIQKIIVLIDGMYKEKYNGTNREENSYLENMMLNYINSTKKRS